jgi:hypothetical protein
MRVPQRPPPGAGVDPGRDERDGADFGLAVKRDETVRLVPPIRIAVADANPGDGMERHSTPSPDASGVHKAVNNRVARATSNGSPSATAVLGPLAGPTPDETDHSAIGTSLAKNARKAAFTAMHQMGLSSSNMKSVNFLPESSF